MATTIPTDVQEKPARRLSLRANFSWTFVGNLVYAASQWGMLVVLAKFGTPEMVGQFSLALAVTAPVIMLSNLQLRGIQATDAKGDYQFADYLGLRLLSTVLALLIIVGIVWLSDYRWETAAVILVVGLAKSFEAISDIFYGLLQQRERMDRIARSMMIKGPLSLAALGGVVWLTGSVLWGVVALAAVWTSILLVVDVRSGQMIMRDAGIERQSLHPRWSWPILRQLIWLALPLGLVMMLLSLNTNIPRYVIESYWGETALGFYASMAYLIVAGTTIVSALGQSASPRLAQYYAAGNIKAFRWLLLRLVGIGTLLGIGAVTVAAVAGSPILTLIYAPEYAAYADVFVLIMIAAGLSYIGSFFGYGMTSARYFKAQLPLFLIVVIITAGGSFYLIPIYGLAGAALALILSLVVQIIGSFVVVAVALNKRVIEKRNTGA